MNEPVSRRSLLSFMVKAPVAVALLSALGPSPGGQPSEPIQIEAEPEALVEITFETWTDRMNVTSFGDQWERYVPGATHYAVNGIAVTQANYEEALGKVR